MKVTVVDPKVRHNIALFQHLMRRQLEKRCQFKELLERTYRAYVNCETGEWLFHDGGEGWKAIDLFFSEKDGEFELKEPESDQSFDCRAINAKALKVIGDTLKTLGGICGPKSKNAEQKLRCLVELEMELPIHEAWHDVDRMRAEDLLSTAPIGTYLFRKGEFAAKLEEELNESRELPVACILITYRDWEEKIGEKTIVYRDGAWLFYDDDPKLEGESYPSLDELLGSQEKLFRRSLKK